MLDPTKEWQIIQGDSLEVLRQLPDGIVQCCITSPPFFGLRDYGTAKWEGGDSECDHKPPNDAPNGNKGQLVEHAGRHRGDCRKCGEVLKLVKQRPGSTSTELYYAQDGSYPQALSLYAIRRRLSNLKNAGHIRQGPLRKCQNVGRLMVTWEG
jgi:hypothetical protein